MNPLYHSTLTVYSDRLRGNIRSISKTLSPGCSVIAVLKCDAYGLGAVRCAEILEPLPQVRMFAVAHVSEGLALRNAGIKKDILVMAPALPGQWQAAADTALTLTVGRTGMIPQLAALSGGVSVQLKLETGLHRTGLLPKELKTAADELHAAGNAVRLQGVFSHFCNGGDAESCRSQYECYLAGVQALEGYGIAVPMRHISASESSEHFREYDLDAVRLGRRLFMDNPAPNGSVTEVMEWKTRILDLRVRRSGERFGYGSGAAFDHDSVLADIGVGYGDGLPEALAKCGGKVLIHGVLCPIAAICMDQTLVDVTGVDCAVGDTVTIFGSDESGCVLTSQEQALVYGGNEGCEITSSLPARVYREYC